MSKDSGRFWLSWGTEQKNSPRLIPQHALTFWALGQPAIYHVRDQEVGGEWMCVLGSGRGNEQADPAI